jgi:fatty acid desaturase
MDETANRFFRYEGPTFLVAIAIYSLWILLICYNTLLPWWLIMPAGAYLIAWQFSLQHEAIHSFRGVPAWLRLVVVFPPLGLWFPYVLYRESHSIHHRDPNLTSPGKDTESYYVYPSEWARMGRMRRGILIFNQTLLGRLLIGPALRLEKLALKESARIRRGDYSHVSAWLIHVPAVALLLWFCELHGMPWWKYILLVAYPGMSLGLLRAFIEHRAASAVDERTASVESNVVFGLLFLYNNIHIVHHLQPTLPWYRIPAHYRANRETFLTTNGHFVWRGYGEIARKFFVRPVFHPIHPFLTSDS